MATGSIANGAAACLRNVSIGAAALILSACAATTTNYKPPEVKGFESAMVISGTRSFAGSACLASIVVDGKEAGSVGPQETLVIPVKPGQYFVRWDIKESGLCPRKEDLAHRLVAVRDGPVLIKLAIGGVGKMFIPIVGLFASPEHRILLDGEE